MLHEGQYKENAFTPVINAMELCDYVFTITDNAKKFPEYTVTKRKFRDNSDFIILQMREDSIVNKVRQQAYDIYMEVFTANDMKTITSRPMPKAVPKLVSEMNWYFLK